MLSEDEIKEVRRLAKLIRAAKKQNRDAITWQDAIDQVIRENTNNEEDYFRQRALMDFFLDEGRQYKSSLVVKTKSLSNESLENFLDGLDDQLFEEMISIDFGSNEALGRFLEGLDGRVAELKERNQDYCISEEERQRLNDRIEIRLTQIGEPAERDSAFDCYHLLIDKIFVSNCLDDLLSTLWILSDILSKHYPKAFQEVHLFTCLRNRLPSFTEAAKLGITKKDTASLLDITTDTAGLLLYRLTQIGIFDIRKKGRENLYHLEQTDFDVNKLRKEWSWLWSHPYKQISIKLYNT